MKFQPFLILFLIAPEILFSKDYLGHGNEMIAAWSFSAFFSFVGLIFVIYGLFSKDKPKKANFSEKLQKNSSSVQNDSNDTRKSETFGAKEEELFLTFAESVEKAERFESITLYLLEKEELFPVYRKKGGIVITPTEKIYVENEHEILKKLISKEGVFNKDHSSVFLPLSDMKMLFGAIEFTFGFSKKTFEVSETWKKVKEFSRDFLRYHSYQFSQRDEETGFYNRDFFGDILRLKSTENNFDSLILIRVCNINSMSRISDVFLSEMINLFGESIQIFRLSDFTIGFFLTKNENEIFQGELQKILSALKIIEPEISLSVGSCDKSTDVRLQNWYKKAESALFNSIESGQNHFKHYSLK